MDLAELVNQPNMARHEIEFPYDCYIVHKGCEKWRSATEKREHRQPMLTRVNNGPIRCELCGRRASRELRQIVEKNSEVYTCQELINCDKEVTLRFYTFSRPDLSKKGFGGWSLSTKLAEELL
jgi:hypothetical protein